MKNPLFFDMETMEISSCLKTLHAYQKNYDRNEIIFHAGEYVHEIGILLQGSITIESNDLWGNRTILNYIEKNGLFAESYALSHNERMMVNVCANEYCTILFLDTSQLFLLEESSWKNKLMINLLRITSKKNIHLSQRSFYTSHKTIRQRVFSYLTTFSIQNQTNEFDIPLNRQQLADHLNVERTALSKELAKMEKEGILSFKKNHFKLKEKADFIISSASK